MEKGFLPAQPVIRLLKEAGVEDWDDRVVYQLLEFQHATTYKLLEGAKEFAMHRGKSAPTEVDLRMALDTMESNLKATKIKPSPAGSKRQRPLPGIKPSKKLRLPPTGLLINDVLTERGEDELEDLDLPKPRPKPKDVQIVPNYNIKKSSKKIEVTLATPTIDQDTGSGNG